MLDTQGFGDLLTEHTCTTQFDPAHTLDIHFRFHTGLGIWEIGGPEPEINKPHLQQGIWDMEEQMGVNMRDAALGMGVSSVPNAIQQLGLFP